MACERLSRRKVQVDEVEHGKRKQREELPSLTRLARREVPLAADPAEATLAQASVARAAHGKSRRARYHRASLARLVLAGPRVINNEYIKNKEPQRGHERRRPFNECISWHSFVSLKRRRLSSGRPALCSGNLKPVRTPAAPTTTVVGARLQAPG